MTIQEVLNLVSEDSIIFDCNFKDWGETNHIIKKTIFNVGDKYQSFNKGDIYFRANGKSIRVHIFMGTKTSFFDQDFGAGEIEHKAIYIDVNLLVQYTQKNTPKLFRRLCEVIQKKTGIKLI